MFHKKAGAAPTHGWLISNRFLRWCAWAFLALVLVTFIAVYTITYTLRRDCTDVYDRTLKFPGYWLHIEAGSTKSECPQP